MAQPPNALFADMSSVMDAGGVDGFLREVLAEVRTRVMAQARAGDIVDFVTAEQSVAKAVTEVMLRRIKPDLKREFFRSAQEAFARCPNPAEAMAAAEAAMQEAEERNNKRIHALIEAMRG